jgi:hypothetical protein
MAARLQYLAVRRGDVRGGEGRAADPDEVAFPDLHQVVDEDAGQPVDSGICHASRVPSERVRVL